MRSTTPAQGAARVLGAYGEGRDGVWSSSSPFVRCANSFDMRGARFSALTGMLPVAHGQLGYASLGVMVRQQFGLGRTVSGKRSRNAWAVC